MSSSIENNQSTTVENSTIPNIVIRSASLPQEKIPTQKNTTTVNTEIIGFSKPYLFSITGILRILLIVNNLSF
jgi:hypothetical protein